MSIERQSGEEILHLSPAITDTQRYRGEGPIYRDTLLDLPVVTTLQGFHVTDEPHIVMTVLLAGIPLDRGYDVSTSDDLQASGLYFSEAPQLWVGRAANKWRFAKRLTEEERATIAQAMLQDSRFTGGWYLTDSERERADRYLGRFVETGNDTYLHFLAEQPYNFQSWKPSFLSPLGITNPEVPFQVPMKVSGLFANLTSARISGDLITTLKRAGYDGAFIQANMSLLPQSVVWNNKAVVQFGDFHQTDPNAQSTETGEETQHDFI